MMVKNRRITVGNFLAPPFKQNTCIDRNGDGYITTSGGLVPLPWPHPEPDRDPVFGSVATAKETNMRRSQSKIALIMLLVAAAVLAVFAIPAVTQSTARERWELSQASDAIDYACEVLGIRRERRPEATASVVTLAKDDTPYLSSQIVGKPLWCVTLTNWSFELKSYPEGYKDLYKRTVDIYLDPLNKQLIKIATRWPEGIPEMPPMVDAEEAAAQMAGAGAERFFGFPKQKPRISFLDALDSIWQPAGQNPMTAEQVIGRYVMWSKMRREPKAVWAIMLRGVPVFKPPPGMPLDAETQYTSFVDAETGEWIGTTNIPRPALGK